MPQAGFGVLGHKAGCGLKSTERPLAPGFHTSREVGRNFRRQLEAGSDLGSSNTGLRADGVEKLIDEYEQHISVKELAQRFGIHRLTVTAPDSQTRIRTEVADLCTFQVADTRNVLGDAGRHISKRR
jgi:hypothetical protein